MASLKQEIEAAALRLGSRGGMPSRSIKLNLADNSTYIAPCDGYLCAFDGALCGYEFCRITSESGYIGQFGYAESSGEFEISLHVPLAKGQAALVVKESSPQIYFIPTLGSST